jgi:hypothetical protein
MMLRYLVDEKLHEQHYFFCINGSAAKVSRYSISQSWLSLYSIPNAIPSSTKMIYCFHDGGVNEYNNSSGLYLYSLLQRLWDIKFEINCFIAYHGKGPWDGLLGTGARIMNSRASLIKFDTNLHYNQEFYYRSLASIRGKDAEVSKAFPLEVCFNLKLLLILF